MCVAQGSVLWKKVAKHRFLRKEEVVAEEDDDCMVLASNSNQHQEWIQAGGEC